MIPVKLLISSASILTTPSKKNKNNPLLLLPDFQRSGVICRLVANLSYT